jgi:hypothetical protein
MQEAEQRHQPDLFKLRLTTGVERAMYEQDWQDAGAGWQGKDGELRLMRWSRQRRIERSLLVERNPAGQLSLSFVKYGNMRFW